MQKRWIGCLPFFWTRFQLSTWWSYSTHDTGLRDTIFGILCGFLQYFEYYSQSEQLSSGIPLVNLALVSLVQDSGVWTEIESKSKSHREQHNVRIEGQVHIIYISQYKSRGPGLNGRRASKVLNIIIVYAKVGAKRLGRWGHGRSGRNTFTQCDEKMDEAISKYFELKNHLAAAVVAF